MPRKIRIPMLSPCGRTRLRACAVLTLGCLLLLPVPAATQSNPCAAKNPCNPCATKNPCNPCAYKNPCNPCSAKNPCNPCATKNPCNPCVGSGPSYPDDPGRRILGAKKTPQDLLGITDKSMSVEEYRRRSDEVQRQAVRQVTGQDSFVPSGPHPYDPWVRLLYATHDNPLISQQCMNEALELVGDGFDAAYGDGGALTHYEEHQRQYKAREDGDTRGLISDQADHVLNCPSFCKPFLGKVLNCHIEAVTKADKEIVFFPVGDAELEPEAQERLRALLARNPDSSIAIFGSASKLSNPNQVFDYALSNRRAQSVYRQIRSLGFDRKILVKALGWQEPRLSNPELARNWNVYERFQSMPVIDYMNQNVVVVAFPVKPGTTM